MSVRVERIHPTHAPGHELLDGQRTDPLGFWVGMDVDVVGLQILKPYLGRGAALQRLIREGEAVSTADFHAALLAKDEAWQNTVNELKRKHDAEKATFAKWLKEGQRASVKESA